MEPTDRPTGSAGNDRQVSPADLRHAALVIATGPDAEAQVAAALARATPPRATPGGAQSVVDTLPRLQALRDTRTDVVGYTGTLTSQALDQLLAAVAAGRRVYAASDEGFIPTRDRALARARAGGFIDPHSHPLTQLWIIPLG